MALRVNLKKRGEWLAMNKGFWDTYVSDYIIDLSEKYIDNKEYGIIVLPEGTYFTDLGFKKQDSDVAAFFEPIFPDINNVYKWYEETFNLPDMTHIKGFLVFSIESMKRNLTKPSAFANFIREYSLMNDIKYLIIHECRHALQNRLLRNEFKESEIIYSLIDLDKLRFDLLEYDAIRYAFSKTTNNKYTGVDYDKAFIESMHYLYDKDLYL